MRPDLTKLDNSQLLEWYKQCIVFEHTHTIKLIDYHKEIQLAENELIKRMKHRKR